MMMICRSTCSLRVAVWGGDHRRKITRMLSPPFGQWRWNVFDEFGGGVPVEFFPASCWFFPEGWDLGRLRGSSLLGRCFLLCL
jgi:hypothetical protein